MGDERSSTATPLSELRIVVAPPVDESAFEVVEDDGRSTAWEAGAVARTALRSRRTDGGLIVEIGARAGTFRPSPRKLVVELRLDTPPDRVEVDGTALEVRWDAARRAAEIAWQDDGSGRTITVRGGFAA